VQFKLKERSPPMKKIENYPLKLAILEAENYPEYLPVGAKKVEPELWEVRLVKKTDLIYNKWLTRPHNAKN